MLLLLLLLQLLLAGWLSLLLVLGPGKTRRQANLGPELMAGCWIWNMYMSEWAGIINFRVWIGCERKIGMTRWTKWMKYVGKVELVNCN